MGGGGAHEGRGKDGRKRGRGGSVVAPDQSSRRRLSRCLCRCLRHLRRCRRRFRELESKIHFICRLLYLHCNLNAHDQVLRETGEEMHQKLPERYNKYADKL